ncbi:MAG: leucine-rich repeat domain-containing protein [Romboutsia timonensis]|uniref:leucine-rich repeat domain-containing protein n=1 Tax=Romboutsia timonensis TaxID=1776391 RepID=UPI002A761A3F|nr:leucine-rich repeat domain-containing protein [Romboutsia timonensis]MDY3001859.1 leucine-rich repeat domain-containing protein [Romboutsia timonensis]
MIRKQKLVLILSSVIIFNSLVSIINADLEENTGMETDSSYDISNEYNSALSTVMEADSYDLILIPDPELRSVLNVILGQDSHEKISKTKLAQIEKIESKNRNISNLDGLQYCTNLRLLNLNGNQISDISSISNLINLKYLYLEGNQISDISPLSNLTNLNILNLNGNRISDIRPLINLIGLNDLYLRGNQIGDTSSLVNLTNLKVLNLTKNKINNINFLNNLTTLKELYLNGNQISDISSISNLINLKYLYLEGNQISDISPLSNLTNLIGIRLGNQKIKLEKITLNSTRVEIENKIKNLNGEIADYIYDINNNGKYICENNLIKWDNIKQKGILKYNFRESVNIGGALNKFSGTVEQTVEIDEALKRRIVDKVLATSLMYIIGGISIIVLILKVVQKRKSD